VGDDLADECVGVRHSATILGSYDRSVNETARFACRIYQTVRQPRPEYSLGLDGHVAGGGSFGFSCAEDEGAAALAERGG